MKMHFTKMLTVCCAIVFGAFVTTDALAQGETCATAVAPVLGLNTADGPATGAGAENVCGETTPGGNADWYVYTPPANGTITVSSCLGGADTRLSILTGSCGALSCVDNTDDDCPTSVGGSSFAAELTDVAVLGGQAYYIQWDDRWTTAGFDWNFSFTEVTTPDCEGTPGGTALPGTPCDDNDAGTVNDTYDENCDCVGTPIVSNNTPCTATALACGDTVSATLAGATAFGSDECFGTGEVDVYFSFTADGTQTYRVAVLDPGFDFDGVVELLEGPDCNSLTVVGECDDFPEEFTVTEAGNYVFRVRPFSSTETDGFDVTVECTPFDCPGLGNIGGSCDDGDPGTVNDEIQADCSCVGVPQVSNDTPCSATALACGDTVSATLAGATAFGSDDCFGDGEVDVYFSFTADGTQTYRVAVLDPGFAFDGVVELLEGPDCNSLTVVGECDDFPEEFTVTEAGNYVFRVRPFSSTETDGFDVTVECTPFDCPNGNIGDPCEDGDPATEGETIQADCSCDGGVIPPANDDCEDVDAQFLLNCGESISGSTAGALAATNSPSGCGFTPFDTFDVWYAFQADGTSSYTVTVAADTSSLSWDGVLYVYSGVCGSLVEIGCSDSTFSGGTEAVELITPAAGVYYVQFYDYGGTDSYVVSLDCDDNCEDPFPAVDEASLSTTFLSNAVATSWDPVPGQIGCQVQLRLAGGTILGAQIVSGTGASSLNIPGSVLQLGTDYEWRVRCGCSQTPLVAGPFSSWQPFTTPGGAAITSMPNPTEGQSNVTFTVVEEGYTTLEVFDMSGRLVDAIFTGNAQPNNEYRFEFDGSALPNGVYIYRLTTDNEVVNDKFMIAR